MNYQKFLKTAGLFLLLAPMVELCNAQNGSWQPLWLSTTGYFKGVEGFYQLSSCNGTDVVFIKLINHNGYDVKTSWQDLVNNNSNNLSVSIKLTANTEDKGGCTGNDHQLIIKLKDYGLTASNFKNLYLKNFDVIQIQ